MGNYSPGSCFSHMYPEKRIIWISGSDYWFDTSFKNQQHWKVVEVFSLQSKWPSCSLPIRELSTFLGSRFYHNESTIYLGSHLPKFISSCQIMAIPGLSCLLPTCVKNGIDNPSEIFCGSWHVKPNFVHRRAYNTLCN